MFTSSARLKYTEDTITEITEDTIMKDLKSFKRFLYTHFNKYEKYSERIPSHQAGRLFATSKTHKFQTFEEINL